MIGDTNTAGAAVLSVSTPTPGQEAGKVEEQLARADNKAALLLGLFLGLAAYLADLAGRQTDRPAVAMALLWGAAAAFVGAAFMVAWAVRPSLNLASGRPYGFMAYIQVEPGPDLRAVIAATNTEEALEHRVVDLSWVAYGRNRRIRAAINLAAAGLVLAVLAAIANAVLS